ncbi:alpha-amylase family glycosyl hydrolase [Prolixibacteraceae bacterium Z1-6]|uniref:Alpha-amylase family glycosyl hydrolase n=1 Tax=Draconibacterium aestuarii TaxID=2998507 RepID=A0A9X3F6K6_9BACT|nr:alpha-amylase family glycosyl hydrolase [Prolixibacteraceae bacterium Z1-6]
MKRLFPFLFACLIAVNLSAQITTEPQLPVAGKAVKITFDSSKESTLGYYTGDLYAHTGVSIEGKGEWQNVIGNWGENNVQPKLTHLGNGIYELEITPDINTFYSVEEGDKVTEMSFVFRSSTGSPQTNDLFVKVYEQGLAIQITEPENNSIVAISDTVTFTANSSIEATIELYIDDILLAENTGTTLSTDHIFTESGTYWLIATATADSTVRDSVSVSVRPSVIEEPKPEAYKKGINYPTDNSAALVLWAPLKEFVYIVGDFNNWQVSNDYLMKKDGDYFWLDIANLEKGTEYGFQYLIDGTIKIADPYTEKILDPWNDSYISEETYPNLKTYPEGKTEGIISVLQPGQEEYNWEVNDFQMPEKEKMVIYEMLIRDFTEEHTYASIIEKLDYLEDLRINVLELMPVNEFEGNNSWGYNPSFYFAPDKYYGPKNELKRLIDECHKRGIAVVIDMVLNHSYGQSPFVQMYMNNWTITEDNPWYNIESPNPVYSWGYDFNHEATATKELVDSVNSFWINEYKVDGFRFDFTKGFTNTPGDGSAYDMPRIAILQRMANEIWNRNPDALVILEHLTGNSEEMALANYGMMLWGNLNHNYGETAMGYGENLSWGIYSNRGWNDPNLVTYMESHDEERLLYKCVNYGNSNGSYNTKELATALNRIELNSVFFIPLPGPKMIWQFGELGYDYSINTCEDGTTINNDCRTALKPIRWDYMENTDRTDLFQVMAKLNELKQSYDEFSPDNTEYSLASETKWYKLSKNNKHIIGLGNFGVQQNNINITFPETGKYYEFFTKDSIEITSAEQSFMFAAGEYRMYSTQQFDDPDVVTDIEAIPSQQNKVLIYPNPAHSFVTFRANDPILKIEMYSLSGRLLKQEMPAKTVVSLSINDLNSGVYLAKVYQKNSTVSKKLVVK